MLFLRRVGVTLGYQKKMGKAYPNSYMPRTRPRTRPGTRPGPWRHPPRGCRSHGRRPRRPRTLPRLRAPRDPENARCLAANPDSFRGSIHHLRGTSKHLDYKEIDRRLSILAMPNFLISGLSALNLKIAGHPNGLPGMQRQQLLKPFLALSLCPLADEVVPEGASCTGQKLKNKGRKETKGK